MRAISDTKTAQAWQLMRARTPMLLPCAIYVAVLLIVHWLGNFASESPLPFPDGDTLYQAVVRDVDTSPRAMRLTADVIAFSTDSITTRVDPVRASVTIAADWYEEAPRPSDTVSFTATLSPPQLVKDVEEEIVPDIILAQRGVRCFGLVTDPEKIAVTGRSRSLLAMAAEVGAEARLIIDRSPLTSPAKDFLKAVLTADSDALVPSRRDVFAASGLAHLLALSGTHVGIITMLLNLALFPLIFWGFRRTSVVLVILALWAFAMITGMSASVVRAVVMASVFMLARLFQRRSNGLNSLLTAALLILIVSPSQLFTIGFQLSFAAVASIIIFSDVFTPPQPLLHPVRTAVCQWLGIAISANLGTALVAAYHFHFFPAYFMVANVAASVLIPLFIGGGIGVVVCGALCTGCTLLATCVSWIYNAIWWIVEGVASLPGASVDNIYFPAWVFAPYLFMLVMVKLATVTGNRRLRPVYISCAAASFGVCACVIALEGSRSYPDEWILTRLPGKSTTIVMHRADSLVVYTSAGRKRHADIMHQVESRYADYAARRGIIHFAMAPESGDHTLIVGRDTLYVVSASSRIRQLGLPRHCSYLIHGSDTRLPISASLGMTSIDTLVSIGSRELPLESTIPLVSHTAGSPAFRRSILP